MKIHANAHTGTSGRAHSTGILAGLAAIFVAALPAWGGAGSTPPGGNASGGQFLSGDETIGTLPVMGGSRIELPFTRGWRGISPAFALEGSAADLSLVILAARGSGFVSQESVDPLTGRIRLAFHGDVLVALDRELAASLPIQLSLAVPASFGEGRMLVTRANGSSESAPLPPGILPWPVATMSSTSATGQAPARIRTGNAAGVRTSHAMALTADLLILAQSN